MLDFLMVATRLTKSGVVEVYPKFIIKKSSDLMIRGSDFYAIWVEERKLWSTDEQDALQLIDRELDAYVEKNKDRLGPSLHVLHMWDAESGRIDAWHKYCQRQMRDSFHMLDEQLIFANTETTKTDFASHKLPYPLEDGEPKAWNKLVGTLYSEEERRKIEWAIGSIVNGDSKIIQKFLVLYGAAGTGKSTVLNVIQQLFDGYTSVFDARALGSASNSFALEAFKTNPLVAIQHDGDLSHIEDNTRINSLVSHEVMTVNEKFRSAYENRFKCFLFMGTNKPVKITDAKSGLIRRLIDVTPSGNKVSASEYKQLMKQISFELGAIAIHCRKVYEDNRELYDGYIPTSMMGASNDFYNFVIDSWYAFDKEDETTLQNAWEMYKTYCDDAKVAYPYSKRAFKEELRNYFREFVERDTQSDGQRVRNLYRGFRRDKFETKKEEAPKQEGPPNWLIFSDADYGKFDALCAGCLAQYAKDDGTPSVPWDKVTQDLRQLDPRKLHYVRVPIEHIVIDFDIPGPDGQKSLERNLEAASKWPPTYAELSKSGKGIHLHYIYTGDPTKLSRVYDDHIEVKVYNGKSSLRRMLTKANDLDISRISSGLPLKEEKPLINQTIVQTEKGIRTTILRSLNKEYEPHATKPSVDYILEILDRAYKSGLTYDVSDMRSAIMTFAASSTHQAEYCMRLVGRMRFKSKDLEEGAMVEPVPEHDDDKPIAFFDTEVMPNLFVLDWKKRGEKSPVVRMINPSPTDVQKLISMVRLVGFNCRKYDNHILYAHAFLRYTPEMLYCLSQKIVSGAKDAMFPGAYDLSYTDVYDFASKKQSLKKWEIELGIHHQELGLPWDQPVPEELWMKVAEYCANDVIATEAVFEHLQSDFLAREILADVAGSNVNDTTNNLTTKIIFEGNKRPQGQFNYRDLSKPVTA